MILKMSPAAGFTSSQLLVRVVGQAGEILAESEALQSEPAASAATALVLQGRPERVFVAYGNEVLEIALP